MSSPSTPAAPLLALTRFHAACCVLSRQRRLQQGASPPPSALPTLCPGAHGAGRRLRHWQLHARLHRALPPPARIAPASDAWPLTSPCLQSLTLVRPFALSLSPGRRATGTTTTSADFSLRQRPSGFHPQGEISPGKNALHRCTTAGSTPPRLDHESFAVPCPLALLGSAFYPVLVHRLAASLHASSPHSVALMQLRFTSFAVINLRRDLHPRECARAGRTCKTPTSRLALTSAQGRI
jgi:hypothetical protein